MKDEILVESPPQSFFGIRNAISFALAFVVVAETFIGCVDGLGYAVGCGLNTFFLPMDTSFVHWFGK